MRELCEFFEEDESILMLRYALSVTVCSTPEICLTSSCHRKGDVRELQILPYYLQIMAFLFATKNEPD